MHTSSLKQTHQKKLKFISLRSIFRGYIPLGTSVIYIPMSPPSLKSNCLNETVNNEINYTNLSIEFLMKILNNGDFITSTEIEFDTGRPLVLNSISIWSATDSNLSRMACRSADSGFKSRSLTPWLVSWSSTRRRLGNLVFIVGLFSRFLSSFSTF